VAYEDLRYGDGPATLADWVVTVLVTLLITGGPAAAGALASTRRELAASVDALRAAEADRDDAVAARVRADERSRIARDMHDIVGHYASLIAVQASALESNAPDEQTRRTARTVRELSSRALDEMRSAVTTWLDRPDDEPATGNWTRWVLQPAVAAGESGVQVTVEVAEVLPAEVDEPALRALQRVVQEGITNAIRHSPGADVRVRLDTDGELVRVEVHNAAPGAGPPTRGGRGLVGLVDRIGALGGTVDAGPDLFGKWVLRASVPPGRRTPGGGYVR
ncbi:MAG TPA: histidine kinase, partial [Pseudonocardiaceae bacterium]|nr:histidine kinase [Pseudonocardiaceae bacterium]